MEIRTAKEIDHQAIDVVLGPYLADKGCLSRALGYETALSASEVRKRLNARLGDKTLTSVLREIRDED